MSAHKESSISQALRAQPFPATIGRYQALFAQACTRIEPLLGEVTLRSILSNMIEYVGEEHPCLKAIELEGGAVNFEALYSSEISGQHEEAFAAMETLFEEFVDLIGDLTSDYFTDELRQLAHATLQGRQG